MASGNIRGITIEIGGDTKNLEKALSNVSSKTKGLQTELKAIEKGLKFDPGNTELIAQRQEVLAQVISETSKRLDVLKSSQAQVQAQFDSGQLPAEDYRAFQRELQTTENVLNRYRSSLGSIEGEQSRLSSSTNALGTLFQATGTNVDQFANVLGTRLTRAIKDGSASADQINRAIELIGRQALGSEVDIEQLNQALRQVDDGGNIDDVRRDLSRLTSEADESGEAVNGFGQKLKGIAGTFAKVAAGTAVAVGAIGAAVFGLSAPLVRAAGDLQALNAQFDIVFGELGKQATESLNRIGEETGVATGRLKGTFTQIAAFAKTSGADTAQALDISSRATLAAADSAAFYDRSIEEVAESLQSFLKGNYANDASLGVSATEFTRNAVAAELFGQKFKDLTEIQKQEALLKLVEDGNALGGALGQAARETDGLENVLGNLDDAFETLKAALGEQIFQYAIDGIKFLTKTISELDLQPFFDAFDRVKAVVIDVLNVVVPFVQRQLVVLKSLFDSQSGNLSQGFSVAFQAIKTVVESVINAVVPFLRQQLITIKKYWDENGEQILQAASKAFDGIKAVIDFVMPAIQFVIQYVWTAIKNVITGALDVILGVVKVFSSALNGDFTGLWDGIKQIFSGAIDLILGLMSLSFVGGIRTAVTGLFKTLTTTVKTQWTTIANTFKSFASSIPKTVGELATKTLSYFSNLRANAVNLVTSMATGLVNAIKSLPGRFLQIGKDIVNGLINGIKSINVVESVKALASTVTDTAKKILKIKSPSRVFMEIGKFVGEGLAIGIDGEKSNVQKSIEDLSGLLIDVAESNADKEKEILKKANDDILKLRKDSAEKIAALQKSTSEKALKVQESNSKKKKGATTSELRGLENLRISNAAKILKIEQDTALKVNNINTKANADVAKSYSAVYKDILEEINLYINNKKSLDQLTLVEEATIWERSISIFEEGSKERVDAQKAYQKTIETINNQINSTNQKYLDAAKKIDDNFIKQSEDLTNKYNSTLEAREKSLYSFAGTFDFFDATVEKSGQDLLANLNSQVQGFRTWQQEIEKLSEKAIDDGLIAELTELGPKALAELRALNSLSESELQKYSNLYKEKSKQAREQAQKELQPLENDTKKQIELLRKTANQELSKLEVDWSNEIKSITDGTNNQLKTLESIGQDAVRGLIKGLESLSPDLQETAKKLGDTVSQTTKKTLDIRSPSRVMRSLGEFAGAGLVQGLLSTESQVRDSAKKIAEAIIPDLNFNRDEAILQVNRLREELNKASQLSANDRLEIERKSIEELNRLEQQRREALASYSEDVDGSDSSFYFERYKELNSIIQDTIDKNARELKQFDDTLKSRFELQKKYVDRLKNLNQLSLTEEFNLYKEYLAGYESGSEQRYYFEEQAYNLIDKIREENLEKEKANLEELVKTRNLSYEEEFALYQMLLDNYEKGSEQRIYLEERISSLIETIRKERFNKEKEDLDKLVKANRLSAAQQIKIYEQLSSKYEKGSEENILYEERLGQARLNLYEILNKANDDYSEKINDANKRLIDGEKELNDAYQESVNSRTQSLFSFAGIFDKIEKKSGVTGARLLRNLQGQVDTFKKYQQNLDSLSAKGLSDAVLDELRRLGPDAATEIAALNTLSEEELNQYSALFEEKYSLARSQAEFESIGLKNDTIEAIEQLRKETAKELDLYADEWKSTVEGINKITTDTFDATAASTTEIGSKIIENLQNGLSSMTSGLYDQVQSIADRIRSTIKSALDFATDSNLELSANIDNASNVLSNSAFVSQGLKTGSPLQGNTDNSKVFAPNVTINTMEPGTKALESTLRRLAFQF